MSYSEAQTVLKTSINLSNHLDMISKLTGAFTFFFLSMKFQIAFHGQMLDKKNILNGDIIILE